MRPLRIRFQQLNPNEPHRRIPGAASWRLVGDRGLFIENDGAIQAALRSEELAREPIEEARTE
jgi:hypothetical protein